MYKINKKNKIRTGLNKVFLATVLSSASLSVWAQEGILKGRVVDVEGNPIPGAVVNVLEGSRIALSDENGYFQLKKVVPNDEIYATCVGYLPATEVASELDGGFTIVLKEDTDVYMHTAPVPFGRKPMKYMTEATSVVTGEELEKHPVTVLQNAFTSTVTGVETHGRAGTEAQLEGLPVIPRKKIFYKGKELEEMDLETILQLHPELVVVDELAHTNVEGCRNKKRWQDVMELLDAGINVVSAINIQHIESLNDEVKEIAGIEVKERVPDSVLQEADEVVNIDLTAEELIARLKSGKIYRPEKIQTALHHFFKTENILQLRELALKEVAFRVEKKVESEVLPVVSQPARHVSAAMNILRVTLSARLTVWLPATARLLRYFMCRLPVRVQSVSVWLHNATC